MLNAVTREMARCDWLMVYDSNIAASGQTPMWSVKGTLSSSGVHSVHVRAGEEEDPSPGGNKAQNQRELSASDLMREAKCPSRPLTRAAGPEEVPCEQDRLGREIDRGDLLVVTERLPLLASLRLLEG